MAKENTEAKVKCKTMGGVLGNIDINWRYYPEFLKDPML